MAEVTKEFIGKLAEACDAVGDCWIWRKAKTRAGYGVIWFDGKVRYCHRLSYEFHKGEIPEGLYVMHSCDTPACLNPAHLSVGTQRENLVDMRRKNRHFGKLTTFLADQIKSEYGSGNTTQRKLARKFGVSQCNIWHIVNGRTYGN